MKQLTTLILILVFHLPTPVLAAEPDWLTHPGRWPIMGAEMVGTISGTGPGLGIGLDLGWLVLETGSDWHKVIVPGSPTNLVLYHPDTNTYTPIMNPDRAEMANSQMGYVGFNPIALFNGLQFTGKLIMGMDVASSGSNHWDPRHRNFYQDLLIDSQIDIAWRFKKTADEDTPSWHPGFTLGLRLPGPWMGWRVSYGQLWGKGWDECSLNVAVYPFSPVLESYPQ